MITVGAGGIPGPPYSPILIDLGRDQLQLSQPDVGVSFDITGTGNSVDLQWVASGTNDAFLVFDFNGNGIVDNGAELFGDASPIISTGERASNGFAALAQYDSIGNGGNADGSITPEDEVWGLLDLWVDSNADGVTDPGELQPLALSNLISLPTVPHRSQRQDRADNVLMLWEWAFNGATKGPRRHLVVDVFFDSL